MPTPLSKFAALFVRRPSEVRVGPYVLGAKLGEGAMGAVYRARHATTQAEVAIKVLTGAPDAERIARFEREFEVARRLCSPNIVAVYDSGRTSNGMPYYAMEYVEGCDLEALVATCGPLSPGRVVRLLQQVCAALADVHAAGLVHRDVKAANVGVTADDLVKLYDFGIVKVLGGDPGATAPGVMVGTPIALAPEAITTPDEVDARTDLYAVGALAYFLLTGTDVFPARNVIEMCSHHLFSTPEAPSTRRGAPIPADLEAVILRCLAKEPADRPQTAAELGALLDACACPADWHDADAARASAA